MQIIVLGQDRGDQYLELVEFCAERGIKLVEEKFTSTNSKSMPCKNPVHNIQVEADGRCHWCESKVKQ
jgi:hypothetical protein